MDCDTEGRTQQWGQEGSRRVKGEDCKDTTAEPPPKVVSRRTQGSDTATHWKPLQATVTAKPQRDYGLSGSAQVSKRKFSGGGKVGRHSPVRCRTSMLSARSSKQKCLARISNTKVIVSPLCKAVWLEAGSVVAGH